MENEIEQSMEEPTKAKKQATLLHIKDEPAPTKETSSGEDIHLALFAIGPRKGKEFLTKPFATQPPLPHKPGILKKPRPREPPSTTYSSTMTLHPQTYQDGWIEYKVKCKGTSKPFAKVKAFVDPKMMEQGDPTLQGFLERVLTIKLEENGKDPFSGTLKV